MIISICKVSILCRISNRILPINSMFGRKGIIEIRNNKDLEAQVLQKIVIVNMRTKTLQMTKAAFIQIQMI